MGLFCREKQGEHPHALRLATALSLCLTMTACGKSSNTSPPENPADANIAPAPEAIASKPVAVSDSPLTPTTVCDWLSKETISSAFDGKLPLGEASVSRDSCTYEIPISGLELGQFQFGTTSENMYREYRKYERQPDIYKTINGLGQEAFLLNKSQLVIKAADGKYFNLSLRMIAITFGGNSPIPVTPEEVQSALESLGSALLAVSPS